MCDFYPKPQPIVLCRFELHRGRASGKKEVQKTHDTLEPQLEKLCEPANISATLLSTPNIPSPLTSHFVFLYPFVCMLKKHRRKWCLFDLITSGNRKKQEI